MVLNWKARKFCQELINHVGTETQTLTLRTNARPGLAPNANWVDRHSNAIDSKGRFLRGSLTRKGFLENEWLKVGVEIWVGFSQMGAGGVGHIFLSPSFSLVLLPSLPQARRRKRIAYPNVYHHKGLSSVGRAKLVLAGI